MAVWFTSDTHFGHGGALGLFARPFPSVAAMNEALIESWNTRVGPEDTVWHLGDVAVRLPVPKLEPLLGRLNGAIHLLSGNNDGTATLGLARWKSVQPYAEIVEDGTALVLCHYPLRSWNGMHRGALNLHGHSHGKLAPLPRQRDVGVDPWGFRPVSLEEIKVDMRHPRRKACTSGSPTVDK